MFQIALFGAGKIGEAITGLLTLSGRYQVKVCDHNLERAEKVASLWQHCSAHELDLSNKAATLGALRECDAVISALPYFCNARVAELAAEAGTHYFDLTEDVETTRKVAEIAARSSHVMMPQCGIAPGFISIAANHLIARFDEVDSVKMRVGALPIYPSNRLKYNLTWSTDGVINQYGNMCEVIEGRKRQMAFALEGYERFSMDGAEYEAFNTSGGLGTLADSLEGKVRSLNYKSVRYPGHRDLIAFLMQDLRFNEDRETLKRVFERSISFTAQDKCLILVEVRGTFEGRFVQRSYASTVYNTVIGSHHFGAIQLTTASGVCAPLDLLLSGALGNKRGFVRSEEVPLPLFLDNEFGRYYRDEKAMTGISV